MKRVLLIFMIFMTYSSFAVLPPYIYERYKKEAPDVFIIVVNKVTKLKINSKRSDVFIDAKVIDVCRTGSKVKVNDKIVISYPVRKRNTKKWIGPVPMPILKKAKVYKAYLKRVIDNRYIPMAKNKSFVYLPLKELK